MRLYGLVLVGLWAVCAAGCGGKSKPEKGDLTVTGAPTGEVKGPPAWCSRSRGRWSRAPPSSSPPPRRRSPSRRRSRARRAGSTSARSRSWPRRACRSRPATSYRPRTTKALDGAVLGEAYTFEFFTERITGTAAIVGSKERSPRDPTIRLTFSQEVPLEQVTASCSFTARTEQQPVKLAPDSTHGPAEGVHRRARRPAGDGHRLDGHLQGRPPRQRRQPRARAERRGEVPHLRAAALREPEADRQRHRAGREPQAGPSRSRTRSRRRTR